MKEGIKKLSKGQLKRLKGRAWIGIVFPPGGKGKHEIVALQHPTKNDDPLAVLGAAIVHNWREYLMNEIPSPYVFIASEDRARLQEDEDRLDDFLSKMGNPVFGSKLFHRANYEALMESGLVTGRLLPVDWSERPIAIYSCADGEDLTGKRETEGSPEDRLKSLSELEGDAG